MLRLILIAMSTKDVKKGAATKPAATSPAATATAAKPKPTPKPAAVKTAAPKKGSNLLLDELKRKLRKKYWLLRNEVLDFDSKEDLLNHCCKVLGRSRPEFEFEIQDL